MKYGMKLVLFLNLLVFPSICFAVEYAEYSFDDGTIFISLLNSTDGWDYNFIDRFTRAEIQAWSQDKNDYPPTDRRYKVADYVGRMLNASADKRIFFINLSTPTGPYGFMFIKINEDEYIRFCTGT